MEEELLICPLTGKIFMEPILASNGRFYEKEAIEEKLLYDNYLNITSTLYPSELIDTLVQKYIENHPEAISNRYVPVSTILNKLEHVSNYDQIEYDEFVVVIKNIQRKIFTHPSSIVNLKNSKYYSLFSKNSFLLKFIDESTKSLLEYRIDKNMSLLHIMSALCNQDIINELIRKNLDFNQKSYDTTCLHLALIHNIQECQMRLINVSCIYCCCTNNVSETALHIAIKHCHENVQMALINILPYGSCINKCDINNNNSLHLAMEFSSPKIQVALIRKKVSLFKENSKGVKPIDLIIKHSTDSTLLSEVDDIIRGCLIPLHVKSYYLYRIFKRQTKKIESNNIL